ncbi:MAG: HEAT repeat domain-containing protein [Planctomycetota bacterium]|nr:HEAT repeat domain-containing protein [Planctomycetota bacterium]
MSKSVLAVGAVVFCALSVWPADDRPDNSGPLWGPETEDAAIAELKSLITHDDVRTATWLADEFVSLAKRDPCQLRNAVLWHALIGPLRQASSPYGGDINYRLSGKAKAAGLLGLTDIAYQCLATVARNGSPATTDCAASAYEAALLALRRKEYDQAAEFLALMEKHGDTWVKRLARKQIELLREYVKNPEDPESRVKFAVEALAGEQTVYYCRPAEAIELLAPVLDSTPKPAEDTGKNICRLLQRWTIARQDLTEEQKWNQAAKWVERIINDFPQDGELHAEALLQLGVAFHATAKADEAVRCFQRVAADYPNTRAWPDAQYNVGYLLLLRKMYKDAIAAFDKLLNANVNNWAPTANIMAPLANYQHQACLGIVSAYEGLEDFPAALKALQASATKHKFQSWCGTCLKAEQDALAARTRMLEALARKPSASRQELAAVAVDQLRQGNIHAARIVTAMGRAAVPALKTAAQHNDASVRRAVAESLLAIGAEAEPALPELITLARDGNADTRRSAIKCLAGIGPPAREAIPALVEVLKESGGTCPEALDAIRAIGPQEAHVPALAALLSGKGHPESGRICQLLAAMGPAAKEAVPILIRTGMDKETNLLLEVSRALGAIGDPAVKPVLSLVEEALPETRYDEQKMRFFSAVIHGLAPSLRNELPVLLRLLRNDRWQYIAMSGLQGVGQPAVQPVMELLDDKDRRVRRAAMVTLGRMGAAGRPAVPRLIEISRDQDRFARREAILALSTLAPYDTSILPVLVEGLQSKDIAVRNAAVKGLLAMETAAVGSVSQIEPLLQEPESDTRKAAELAVSGLGVIKRLQQALPPKPQNPARQ